jgi:hypothetical protein
MNLPWCSPRAQKLQPPAHDRHRIPDHREGWDAQRIGRVRQTREGQLGEGVELRLGQRRGRRLDEHRARPVELHQRTAAERVLLGLHQAGGRQQLRRIRLETLPGGQRHGVGGRQRGCGVRAEQAGRAAYAREVCGGAGFDSGTDPAGNLADGALAHAVDQQVGFGIDEDGGPELVLPVVVVRDAPQAGLDPAQHHRQPGEGLAGQLGVDHGGMVRSPARQAALAVVVLAALVAGGGVVGQH